MNEYIIYTTEGSTFGPNTQDAVENCQVLGIVKGFSENDAINKLFDQNEWIHKAGFRACKAFARPLLTASIMDDIKIVIDYLWKEEHTHFQENNFPGGHIFRVLKRLQGHLSFQ